jgi:hypothetical protein
LHARAGAEGARKNIVNDSKRLTNAKCGGPFPTEWGALNNCSHPETNLFLRGAMGCI